MRVQRDDGAFHRWTLRERIITRLWLKPVADQIGCTFWRLHHDDVADGEGIAKIIQRLWPDTILAAWWVGPEGQLERNSAAPAIHIDLRLILGHLGNIGSVMILEHGRLMFGKNLIEVTIASMACQRAAPSLTTIKRLKAALQRHARRMLKFGVQRCADRQPPGIEHVFAKAGHDLAAHFLGKIGCLGGVETALPGNLQRHATGTAHLVRGDEAVLLHLAKDPVAAGGGGAGLADGMVVRRRLGKGCQIGHFLKRQLVERLVEIVQCRRRNTVATHAEIDLVQIEGKDLILGKGPLHTKGQDGFLDLPVDRDLVGQKEILRHLLSDGGGTDGAPSRAIVHCVRHNSAEQSARIDTEMRIEGLVLGREKRLYQPRRHRLHRHENTFFGGVLGNQCAVAGMNSGGHRRLILRQLVVIRQILAIGPEHPENRCGSGNNPQKQKTDKNRDRTDKPRKKRPLPRL